MCGWTGRELECSFVGQTTKTGAEKKKKKPKEFTIDGQGQGGTLHAYHIRAHKRMAAAAAAAAAKQKQQTKGVGSCDFISSLCSLLDCNFLRSSAQCSTFRRNACRTYFFTDWKFMRHAQMRSSRPRGAIDKSSIFFFFFNLHWLFNYRRQDRKKSDAVNSMRLIRFIWWVRHRWK